MKTIELTYLDHSGFAVATSDVVMVFDYYRDPAHALPALLSRHPGLPIAFMVSHGHSDHFNPEIFSLGLNRMRTYVLSDDIDKTSIPDGATIDWVSPGSILTNLPGGIDVHAFGSTDRGVSFMITTQDLSTVFHAGDLNEWHWQDESSQLYVERAAKEFDKVLSEISSTVSAIDVAMFPVDPRMGTDYTRGAKKFLETIKVKFFIPMHFWNNTDAISNSAAFLSKGLTTTVRCITKPGLTSELPL